MKNHFESIQKYRREPFSEKEKMIQRILPHLSPKRLAEAMRERTKKGTEKTLSPKEFSQFLLDWLACYAGIGSSDDPDNLQSIHYSHLIRHPENLSFQPKILEFDGAYYPEILHEICHFLVSNDQERDTYDWNLTGANPKEPTIPQEQEDATRVLETMLEIEAGIKQYESRIENIHTYLDSFTKDPNIPLDFPGKKELIAILRASPL